MFGLLRKRVAGLSTAPVRFTVRTLSSVPRPATGVSNATTTSRVTLCCIPQRSISNNSKGLVGFKRHDPSCRIFVGNLPHGVTDEELGPVFAEFGDVADIQWPPTTHKESKPSAIAWILYASPEGANAVLESVEEKPIFLGGRRLRVEKPVLGGTKVTPMAPPPEGFKVYVGNLPYSATDDDLGNMLSNYGDIMDVRKPPRPDGTPATFAFVWFAKREDADKLVKEAQNYPIYLRERQLVVTEAKSPDPHLKHAVAKRPVRDPTKRPTNTVFMGNLPATTTEEELREFCKDFGTVSRIALTGSRAAYNALAYQYAHVDFASVEEAEKLISTYTPENPLLVNGWTVRLDFADTVKPTVPTNRLFFSRVFDGEPVLRKKLGPAGQNVRNVRYLRDQQTNQITGVGFINFISVREAEEAMKYVSQLPVEERPHLEYSRRPGFKFGEDSNADSQTSS